MTWFIFKGILRPLCLLSEAIDSLEYTLKARKQECCYKLKVCRIPEVCLFHIQIYMV